MPAKCAVCASNSVRSAVSLGRNTSQGASGVAKLVEHRVHHVVADLFLLFQAVALRRVQAEVRPEKRHVLGLDEFGHLGFVHLFISFRVPRAAVGAPGVPQIPLQIIRKGAFSSVEKWCADFSNAPLLTCGFVVFRGGV